MRVPAPRRILTALLPVAFFAAVAWLLEDELAELELGKIVESLGQISSSQLLVAGALMIVAYAVLAVFDVLARDYVHHKLSLATTVAISFVSYAFNFNIGGVAGAVGFRYRLYSRRGIPPADIASITLFAIAATWAGWLLVLGGCLAFRPGLVPSSWGFGRQVVRVVAWVLLALPVLYLWACAAHQPQFRIRRWTYRFPDFSRALAQVVLGAVYWLCPSAVIWMLQPEARSAHYIPVLVSYLLAAMAGLILHVPAGLGVFEAVFLQTLGRALSGGAIVAMLLAYRAVYLLLPLATACVILLLLEWRATRVRALSPLPPDSPQPATPENLRPSS